MKIFSISSVYYLLSTQSLSPHLSSPNLTQYSSPQSPFNKVPEIRTEETISNLQYPQTNILKPNQRSRTKTEIKIKTAIHILTTNSNTTTKFSSTSYEFSPPPPLPRHLNPFADNSPSTLYCTVASFHPSKVHKSDTRIRKSKGKRSRSL